MQTGELTGELEKPTPEIQKAFKRYYGTEPTGIFATGGETLAGKKAKADIAKTTADITKTKAMSKWYLNKSNTTATDKTQGKALEYGLKYANGKLGKPFEILDEDERALWQTYYDEGVGIYNKTVGSKGPGAKTYSTSQQAWITRWRSIDSNKRAQALTNPSTRTRLLKEATGLGLTLEDLGNAE